MTGDRRQATGDRRQATVRRAPLHQCGDKATDTVSTSFRRVSGGLGLGRFVAVLRSILAQSALLCSGERSFVLCCASHLFRHLAPVPLRVCSRFIFLICFQFSQLARYLLVPVISLVPFFSYYLADTYHISLIHQTIYSSPSSSNSISPRTSSLLLPLARLFLRRPRWTLDTLIVCQLVSPRLLARFRRASDTGRVQKRLQLDTKASPNAAVSKRTSPDVPRLRPKPSDIVGIDV